MASNLDDNDTSEEKLQEVYDEFISPIEADMSQVELVPICNALNNLLISLNCRREELASA